MHLSLVADNPKPQPSSLRVAITSILPGPDSAARSATARSEISVPRLLLSSFMTNTSDSIQIYERFTAQGSRVVRHWLGLFCFLTTLAISSAPLRAGADADRCSDLFSVREDVLMTPYGRVVITSDSALALLKDQSAIKAALRLRGAEKVQALLAYAKQKRQSHVNVALTFANYATSIFIASDIAMKIAENPGAALATAALVPATWVAADGVSSAYHYFLDNWASTTNRVWGSAATAFRRHHEVPNNLSQTGFIQNVSAFSVLMAPLYVATAIAAPQMDVALETQALVALLLFSHGTEIHRQSHLPKPNKFVQWLQDKRILLSSEAHNAHHKRPTDSDYGIINGSTNRWMNGVYEKLNRILSRATGRLPNDWIQTPRSIPDDVIRDLVADLKSVPQELIVVAASTAHTDKRVDELLRLWIERFGEPTKASEASDDQP